MTISQVKTRINAVLGALDAIEIKGYSNLCNLQGSMSILQDIMKADIQPDADGVTLTE